MSDLKPFLEDMLSMSTGTDGRTLQIHFSRPVMMADRQAMADAHNAIVRGQLPPAPGLDVRELTEAQQQAQAALDKVMNCRFSNFDAGAVIHWVERGMYRLKAGPVSATASPEPHVAVPIELDGVAERLSEGEGCWRSCSGCHDLNEGVATGPYSKIMKCNLGMGCRECGGIGAVWDNTDYSGFLAPVTAADVNKAFDPANEALGGAFMAGFKEGWIYAEIDADGERYQEMAEEYALAVDSAPQEAWDAHREKFFAMLPLAAIPKMEGER